MRRVLTPAAFVDQVLVPWRTPPVPPPGLVRPGADYLPSSQLMSPAIARRFRGLAWDLIVRSTSQAGVRRRALAAVEALLARVDGEAAPGRRMREMADAEIVEMYCALVRAITGVADPYAAVKRAYTAQALAQLPAIAAVVESVATPAGRWRAAMSLGILGNAMDFADPLKRAELETGGFDMASELRRARTLRYARGLDARDAFLAALRRAPRGEVLFLADNAGEIVFDLPLIRLWLAAGRPVTLVGKSVPCYNDVTADDLRALLRDRRVWRYLSGTGDKLIPGTGLAVLAGGTRTIGLDLRRATPPLVRAWRRAAIVYAKGQGMVQTLRYAALTRDVFHAVQVKDPAYFHEGARLHPGAALFLHTKSS
ncbi:MAG: DUF89 family protein [Candidatus Omnitrophica bacterium]|nr:DUF89 family protein [Candidatus Omnitrophota bacterium]